MAAHTALGWLLATGFTAPDRLATVGLLAWVVALNGGTLALNSAFDRDDDDVAYLRQPPPVPAGLAVVAMALMLACVLATWGRRRGSGGPTWSAWSCRSSIRCRRSA